MDTHIEGEPIPAADEIAVVPNEPGWGDIVFGVKLVRPPVPGMPASANEVAVYSRIERRELDRFPTDPMEWVGVILGRWMFDHPERRVQTQYPSS